MNVNQLGAVTSPATWNLVLAGPGSGKTKVIIERAKWLVESGVDPKLIAFVTYTAIGAKVMRDRLAEVGIKPGFVGTLHAMLLMLLRRNRPAWTMVTEEDAQEFLGRIAKTLGYKGTAAALKAAIANPSKTDSRPEFRVAREYERWMGREGMLDFDMVLTQGAALLEVTGSPWPIWFGDEFQDAALIDREVYLNANPTQLFLVADREQCIFQFRGARPENIDDFVASGKFSVHYLRENYRCAGRVCDVANLVIRIPEKTISATECEGLVGTYAEESDDEERRRVASLATELINTGTAPAEIAILCRTNRLADEMRAHLHGKGLPVAESQSDKKPKDWRLLQMIISQVGAPDNWASARLLAREMAKSSQTETTDDAEQWIEMRRKQGSTVASLWDFPAWSVIRSLNAKFTRYGIGKASHELLATKIRLYDPETPAELVEAMRESPETKTVRGINVMTVHAAKGAEWDSVIIPGAELFKSDDPAEERRLFFVAVTRARRTLYVTTAMHRRITLPGSTMSIIQTREPGEMFEAVQAERGIPQEVSL
jgi:DNA helicase-2/ATP-dependent DNA helicase PcrA